MDEQGNTVPLNVHPIRLKGAVCPTVGMHIEECAS